MMKICTASLLQVACDALSERRFRVKYIYLLNGYERPSYFSCLVTGKAKKKKVFTLIQILETGPYCFSI